MNITGISTSIMHTKLSGSFFRKENNQRKKKGNWRSRKHYSSLINKVQFKKNASQEKFK